MGETLDIVTYIAKEDVYDCAGYRISKIPKGAQVKFNKEYTCFYGRFIQVSYNGNTYYTRPELFKKIITTRKLLTSATSGCYAKHQYYDSVTLVAKIVTESKCSEKEFWIAQDGKGKYHIIEIGDCQSLFLVEEQHEEKVTYFG